MAPSPSSPSTARMTPAPAAGYPPPPSTSTLPRLPPGSAWIPAIFPPSSRTSDVLPRPTSVSFLFHLRDRLCRQRFWPRHPLSEPRTIHFVRSRLHLMTRRIIAVAVLIFIAGVLLYIWLRPPS